MQPEGSGSPAFEQLWFLSAHVRQEQKGSHYPIGVTAAFYRRCITTGKGRRGAYS